MARVIAFASGKGGVGKSLITSNLAVNLAGHGHTVILVDLDLGGSNLHSLVGVENKHPGIGHYYHHKGLSLAELPVKTDYSSLSIITGDSLLPGTANIPYFFKQKLLRDLPRLEADFVFLDLGAGSAYNTVDYFIGGAEGILVSTPEPTSLLNGYAYLKTCYYRKLFRAFKAKSEERKIVSSWFSARLEGAGRNLEDLYTLLGKESLEAAQKARNTLEDYSLDLIINDIHEPGEEAYAKRLILLSHKYFGHSFRSYSTILHDLDARASLFAKVPVVKMEPDGIFSQGIEALGEKILSLSPKVLETPSPIVKKVRKSKTVPQTEPEEFLIEEVTLPTMKLDHPLDENVDSSYLKSKP